MQCFIYPLLPSSPITADDNQNQHEGKWQIQFSNILEKHKSFDIYAYEAVTGLEISIP
jgi:hypothetical protein